MSKTGKLTKGTAASARRRKGRSTSNQRQLQWLLIGAAILFIGVIAIIIYVNIRGAQPVAGETGLNSQGNNHIETGQLSPITYNSTPPTSGPHYNSIASWGIYEEPLPYELLLHNLEDGGVVIYYQCPEGCPETVEALKEIVTPYRDRDRHLVLLPNDPTWTDAIGRTLHKDMEAKIAVTAWQQILKLEEVDADRIRAFIERYEGRDHHVAGG